MNSRNFRDSGGTLPEYRAERSNTTFQGRGGVSSISPPPPEKVAVGSFRVIPPFLKGKQSFFRHLGCTICAIMIALSETRTFLWSTSQRVVLL